MKESIFNVKKEKDNKIILFNTRNKKIIEMTKKDYCNIFNGNDCAELFEEGFLVEDHRNEFIDFLYEFNKSVYNSKYLTITYLTTKKCNLECIYCFEGNDKGKQIQRRITINDFECIYQKLVKESKAEFIDFHFFGGEPLLEYQHILDIMNIICSSKDKKVLANIVTNGYLLNEERVDQLKESGITSFQITIDGDEVAHNRYRKLKNGDGTFKKIMKNINYILGKNIELIINMNYCKENYKHIAKMLEEFPEIVRKKAYIKFNELQTTINNNYISKVCTEGEEINILSYLFDVLKREKYPDFDFELLETGPCVAQLKNSIIIEPDGKISKCIYGIGNSDLSFGNILDDSNLIEKVLVGNYGRVFEKFPTCQLCTYLPMCKGGCVRKYIENNSNREKHECEKQKYAFLVEAILNYYS